MTVRDLALERPRLRALSTRHLGIAIALVAVTAVLASVGYMSMFSSFHAYDDEGYFLILLRDYLSGRPLLGPATPIYGPFFFETMGGLYKLLGLEPGHDSGRYVTLAIWLVTSGVSGFGAFRLTRNLWLAVGVQLTTFGVLAALVNEPMEPFGLTNLLLLSMVAAATFRSTKPRLTATLIGGIVGALLLIKINIGAFAALAVAFAWACSLTGRSKRLLLPILVVAIAAAPVALTLSLLSRPWVLEFVVLVSLSAVAIGIACVVKPPPRLPTPSITWLVAGGTVIILGSLGIAVAGGTRPQDLWDGLVVVSLRLPQTVSWPLAVSPGYDIWAVISLVVPLAILRWGPRGALSPTTAGLARVGVGFFTWLSLLLPPDTVFLLAMPFAWIATQAPRGDVESPTDPYCRVLLPALAVLESLQAYPFAGTQLSLASIALIPVAAVILNDGIRQLRLVGAARSAPIQRLDWVPRAAVLFNVVVFLVFTLEAAAGFIAATPLSLPGAATTRLQAQDAGNLRALVTAVDKDCSSFITLPGMNSFYLWTGQQPPTEVRSEIWMVTLDSAQQQALVGQLDSQPRLCVVRNQRLVAFWAQGRRVPNRPLLKFIDQSFVRAGSYGDYELLTRRQD
jgi:hypothetical protein